MPQIDSRTLRPRLSVLLAPCFCGGFLQCPVNHGKQVLLALLEHSPINSFHSESFLFYPTSRLQLCLILREQCTVSFSHLEAIFYASSDSAFSLVVKVYFCTRSSWCTFRETFFWCSHVREHEIAPWEDDFNLSLLRTVTLKL